jgi:hypothetical protein
LVELLDENTPKIEFKYEYGADYCLRQMSKVEGYGKAQSLLKQMLKKHREELIEKELKS